MGLPVPLACPDQWVWRAPLDQWGNADQRVTEVVRVLRVVLGLWVPWVLWASQDLPVTPAQLALLELWENPAKKDNRDPVVLLAMRVALVIRVLKGVKVQMDLLVKLVLLVILVWKVQLDRKVLWVPWVLLVHKAPVASPVEGVVQVKLVKMELLAIQVLKESRDLVVLLVLRVLRDLLDRQVLRVCLVPVVARAPRANPDLKVHLVKLETLDLRG